jgi:hypothetical protein
MMENPIVFTLRLEAHENAKNKELAESMNISLNALYRLSAALFRQTYADIISQNQAEFRRFLAREQTQNPTQAPQADC